MDRKRQSENGTVQVAGLACGYGVTEGVVNVNTEVRFAMVMDRASKEVTVNNYGLAALPDEMTIGQLKGLVQDALTELDTTVIL